jgi:hypothetical protein
VKDGDFPLLLVPGARARSAGEQVEEEAVGRGSHGTVLGGPVSPESLLCPLSPW